MQPGLRRRYHKGENKIELDDHRSIVDNIELMREQLPSKYSFIQYTKQTIRDMKRNKLNYCLGFLGCFVVVFVVTIMLSVLSHTPVVFLKLSELEAVRKKISKKI